MRSPFRLTRPALAALLLLLAVTAPGLEAQEFRYLAFGDSVTAGAFDEANLGGYPGRLETILGCVPGVCSVDNQGVGGETTGEGVSRLGEVIASGSYDVVLLMSGTNDIFKNPPISNNTIEFNLRTMADTARNWGVDAVVASIIWFHPQGVWGNSRDDEVQDLRDRVIDISLDESLYFADPWTDLCPSQACFDQHYFAGVPSPDPVGHPDASGYDILTDVWNDAIDSAPVPLAPVAVSPAGLLTGPAPPMTWDRESPLDATWYRIDIDVAGGGQLGRWFKAIDVCDPTSCTTPGAPNLSSGTHSWQVRGRNPKGLSPWSAPVAFTVPGATLSLVSGTCNAGPSSQDDLSTSREPTTVTIRGDGFPPNKLAALVMAGGNQGWVKGGVVCNGAAFDLSEPFVLPPTWAAADANGSFTAQISGEQCLVQALAVATCEVSNLLVLP